MRAERAARTAAACLGEVQPRRRPRPRGDDPPPKARGRSRRGGWVRRHLADRPQSPEPKAVPHLSGLLAGRLAAPEIEVGARRPADRAAAIERDDQPPVARRAPARAGSSASIHSRSPKAWAAGSIATARPGSKRRASRAGRLSAFVRTQAEEDVARVEIHHPPRRRAAIGPRASHAPPAPDACAAGSRPIWRMGPATPRKVAPLAPIAHRPTPRPIGEHQGSRSLCLQQEEVLRFHPRQRIRARVAPRSRVAKRKESPTPPPAGPPDGAAPAP